MNYTFYKNDDTITGRRNSDVFEPNEKYYVDDDGVRVDNESYTEDGANAYELERDRRNIKYSGNPSRLYDPSDPVYDYVEARKQRYGSIVEQIEYIAENGITAFRARQSSIKSEYPKP